MTHCLRAVLAGVALCVLGAAPSMAADPAEPVSPEAQALLPLLDASDVFTRQAAFLQIEALRDPSTAQVLRSYAEHRDPDTRAFGLRALAAVTGASAVPVLIEHLQHDRVPRVRVASVLALEPLRDPAATPALISALRDRHPHVRMAAIDVVSRMDAPEAKDAIRQRHRRERNRDVQRVLKQAMARLSGAAES